MGRLLRREEVEVAFVNQAREIRLVGLSQLGRRSFKLVARRGSPDPIKNVWHFRWVYTRLVDRLILNARALAPKVCAHAPWFDSTKIAVIPNGIDVEAYRAQSSAERGRAAVGLRPGQRLVSMVGEVGWRKDQKTFLQALAQLRSEDPDDSTVFAIVGDGDERPRLEAEARQLGLVAPHLCWLGFRRDVGDLLAASDLVVLPSREEGFPNTLLEAMALGRCVVATPVDGVPELVVDGQTGVLVPVGDPALLAESMRELLGDTARRESYGAAAVRRVRVEFDQTAIMARVESLVRELVD
jgi:glycosyltransferase involved in cell wall biosynthesis